MIEQWIEDGFCCHPDLPEIIEQYKGRDLEARGGAK